MRLQTIVRGAAGSVLVIALLYTVVVEVIAPRYLRFKIEDAVETSCSSCRLQIDDVDLEYLRPWNLSFRTLHLEAGHAGGSEVKAEIDSLRIAVALEESTKDKVVIESIAIDGPHVVFTDGDAVSEKAPSNGASGPTFVIRKTGITHGQFVYIRNTKGTSATLHLHGIRADIGTMGTDPAIANDMVNGHFRTQIEKSGEVELDVATLLRPGPDHADVTVRIRDQNLGDLTPFFKPNAGVELKGQLVKARGQVLVRGDEAKVSTWLVYHGLDIKLNSMYDRSEAKAFFMNLGSDLVMADDDLSLSQDQQTEAKRVPREPGERIVGFILRSLKETAISLARSAGSKSSPTASPRENNARRARRE